MRRQFSFVILHSCCVPRDNIFASQFEQSLCKILHRFYNRTVFFNLEYHGSFVNIIFRP